MKNFQAILCLMAVFVIFAVQADPQPQRSRGDSSSTSSSSSSTTETTTPIARRSRTYRRSTTPMPGNPNNDLIRKGLIDKLCTRKYGKGSTTTANSATTDNLLASSTLSTSTSTTTSTSTSAPSVPARRLRSRSRSARATRDRVTSTSAPTFEPSCSDFDELSFEQLVNRNKAGQRPVRRRDSSLKSDASE